MSLPAPHLDDRRFQQLVDEAKRLVQRRCPDWTDHNVSDPGVTLIESFAYMVDQLLYRLNRVPERHYVKFLELIGLTLLPPTAARAPLTFWLSAPQENDLVVPEGTEVSTRRSDGLEPVSFTTIEDSRIVAVGASLVFSSKAPREYVDHTSSLLTNQPFFCFDTTPKPDDALYIGLSDPAPANVVQLTLRCSIEGVGVDPTFPPILWEAWNGDTWQVCEVDHDTTGGLNRDGEVVLHLPRRHTASAIDGQRAGWIRCRVVPNVEFQPTYSASPRIHAIAGASVGVTTDAARAHAVRNEVVGETEGAAHQRFQLSEVPVVPWNTPVIVEVSDQEDGWEEWTRVDSFASSGPDDLHFTLDDTSGTISFGPSVLDVDGTLRTHGAVPTKGRMVRVVEYHTGGGRAGTVAKGALTVLASSIPFISRVENRAAAVGGVDGETVEQAKTHGPILLRTHDRAVTAEDFEHLAKEHCPDVARVRAVPAGDDPENPLGVRILVVPAAAEDDLGRIDFLDLNPPEELKQRIAEALDQRRVLGTRINVEPVRYRAFTVVAAVRARPKMDVVRLERECLRSLYKYFHPVVGGPSGKGWEFGRQVSQGEIYAVLQRLRGVEMIEQALLFAADLRTLERDGAPVDRLPIERHVLPYSYDFKVRVRPSMM